MNKSKFYKEEDIFPIYVKKSWKEAIMAILENPSSFIDLVEQVKKEFPNIEVNTVDLEKLSIIEEENSKELKNIMDAFLSSWTGWWWFFKSMIVQYIEQLYSGKLSSSQMVNNKKRLKVYFQEADKNLVRKRLSIGWTLRDIMPLIVWKDITHFDQSLLRQIANLFIKSEEKIPEPLKSMMPFINQESNKNYESLVFREILKYYPNTYLNFFYFWIEMDIWIPEYSLNIELDWEHHYKYKKIPYDKARDDFLKNNFWISVLRIRHRSRTIKEVQEEVINRVHELIEYKKDE